MSIRGLKYGLSGPIIVNGEEYDGVMQDQGLDDDEIADVYELRSQQLGE